MMTFKTGCALAALAVAIPMTAVGNSNAAPLAAASATPSAISAVDNSPLTQVQWRGRRGGWGPGPGIGLGLAAGALIGGAIAAGSNPYYGYGPGYYGYGGPVYAPAPVYAEPVYGGGDAEAYCTQRYRSYDPASGTYLNYDGNRYPCP